MIYKTLKNSILLLMITASLHLQSCKPAKQKADYLLLNGKVYTVNINFEVMEAFAVKDGQFVAVGSNESIQKAYEADIIYDAEGLPVYPGFIDGHCHFYGFGENIYRYADLAGCKSFDEAIERLKQHHADFPSEWILGRGWDQSLWENQQFPDNEKLEISFPGKKILLIRIDGHASLVSKAALKAANITGFTKIHGGEVVLHSNGQPTGLLIDIADQAVKDLVPKLADHEKETALLEAQKKCFAVGLTSVVDAGLPYQTIELIRKMHSQGKLKMRLNAMIEPSEATTNAYFSAGPMVSNYLTVNSVKMYVDGALGSRGAKLLEPYTDAPGKTGLVLHEPAFYERIAQKAYDAGFQVNMHAIGDSAVRLALKLYASILKGPNDRRWRIEHAQIVHPDDFKYFGQYSIIPSIQSTHATSDMRWASDRVGPERLKGAYAQQQLLQQNGWLVNGTDFPIESINPINTFYAAVYRKDAEGFPAEGFQSIDALSKEQAMRSITIWPAKGSFEEHLKGSIEVGKLADFVILNQDIMLVEEKLLLKTKVLSLYSGGVKVF